jgi:uncharacterized protein HemX
MSTDATDATIKKKIVDSFVAAGPWAVLAVLVIGAVGYQMNWFMKSYINQTAENMNRTAELIESNRTLILEAKATTQGIAEQMRNAHSMMEPAIKEREEQTKILREIKEILRDTRADRAPQ